MTGSYSRKGQGGGQRRLGEFVLLDEIGRGGMGVVYRARQDSLGRVVAVKTLPSFAGLDPAAVARFRREAESAGRIAHPGIVPVYAVGEDQGVYYYAMELVDGPSLEAVLAELIGRNPARLLGTLAEETTLLARCPGFAAARAVHAPTGARYAASCAAIAAEIAGAVAVAHQARIIHRDLKPSNVLLRRDGRAMVVDFGLSRDQSMVSLTHSGDAVGTPSYMAPEQARGSKDIDARVDVYGLGAMLYEMLALRPPFEGAHAADIMRQILEQEPPAVRALNGRVPPDLATIVHKCLAKDRDARYPAMESVEHDLRAFLHGRPIAAQAPGVWARSAAFTVRHRRGIAVAAATTAVLSLAGVVAGWWSSTRARTVGLQALAAAGSDLLEHGSIEQAQASYGRADQLLGDPALVARERARHVAQAFARHYADAGRRDWLQRLLATVPPAARDLEWHAMHRRCQGIAPCTLSGHLLDGETRVALRRFAGGTFAAQPEGWPTDGLLAAGHYVVQVERVGLAPAGVAFQVERDTALRVAVPQLELTGLRADEVLIAPAAAPDRAFALARTELSGAEVARLSAGLSAAQSAELAGIVTDGADRPVHGLSFRQARTLAALASGHLPDAAEFALAARGTVPAGEMPFPWGAQFAAERVNADPVRSSAAEPVDSRPAGASPFGVLHLAGNVAEVLSLQADTARAAGGDWLAAPEQVRSDAFVELGALDAPGKRVGVRVARFVCPPSETDAAAAVAWAARHDELWKEGGPVVLDDWDVDETGRVGKRLRLAAFLDAPGTIELPLSTPGFLQDDEPAVNLGDAAAPAARRVAADGEHSMLRVPSGTLRARQLYRIDIRVELTPLAGLLGQGDRYVLRVPIKATGVVPACSRVILPRGSRVDQVDPPPARWFHQGGRPVLVWEFGADRLGVRAFSGVVRFRKDGFLTGRWPARSEAMAVVDDLFAALAGPDRDRLRGMLAPTFALMPANLLAAALLDPARNLRARFANVRFVDVTAVGPVVTAELVVDWWMHDGAGERMLAAWPLRVHWRHAGEQVRVLQAATAGRDDSGRMADGAYVHDELMVRIRPAAQFTLSRTVGHLAALQVELKPQPDHGRHFVMLLGAFDRADQGEGTIWGHLSDGVFAAGGGRLIGRGADRCGEHQAEREDWQFAVAGGCTRERWWKVRAGRRWLLLRAVALGRTADEAAARWQAAGPWFADVLPRVEIR